MNDNTNKQLEKCALCRNDAFLQNSHFIPSFVYKKLHQLKKKNHHIMVINNTNICHPLTSQIKEHKLCKVCEQTFSAVEKIFSEIAFPKRVKIKNINKQIEIKPFLIDLFLRKIEINYNDILIYHAGSSCFENKHYMHALFYFAISIFWRGSLTWNGHKYCQFPHYLVEDMRKFLSNGEFYGNYIIRIDLVTKNMFSVTTPFRFSHLNKSVYAFQIMNFIFTLKEEDNPSDFLLIGRNEKITNSYLSVLRNRYRKSTKKGMTNNDITWLP